ncbi:MAG: DUF3142 domain-containing protein [Leptolyngbya sp.]|nr:DUF3142 domain-containing protein [Candidatus Melainabacteria bacterium]
MEAAELPSKVLWAWERAEDLSKIDRTEFGVAFLSCHVFVKGDKVISHWRNQPMRVPDETIVEPTIRIDIDRSEKATLSEAQIDQIVRVVVRAAKARNTAQVQIDFDALQNERNFYCRLLEKLRQELPDSIPISITALASWCLYDNWIKNLPVAETVPMMFSLGRDRQKVLMHFRKGGDFLDARCKRSLGLSLEDTETNELMIPMLKKRKIPARVYVFTRTAWTDKKILEVHSLLGKQ